AGSMTESKMDQASPQCMDDDSSRSACRHNEGLPKVVLHFSVAQGATLTWRVDADSTLSVQGARVWLTRVNSPYDHWLEPGNEFRLRRGERVWLSTVSERGARAPLCCALPAKRGFVRRWLGWLAGLGLEAPAAR
ncbi:DUF2917 domain-containing protein, partial [Klebsiella pneumoniae]|nr:DUF2917 domain-containing protein [Klebsiella pneumoniae]